MCNTRQSLAAKLDWRAAFEAFGFGSPTRSCLPQSFECPLCDFGTLSAMDDHVLGTEWFVCGDCDFAGDLIELVAEHMGIDIDDAISVLDSHYLFESPPDTDHIASYISQHIRYRKRINHFWQESRVRPLEKISDSGIALLRKCSLGDNVLRPHWRDHGGQLFGAAEIREVEELFAPLSYEDRVRPNRNGKSSVRRGGGPGKSRLFVGNTWGEVLVIPHYDLPGRIIGFTFIGRDVNPYAGDIIYKRANIGQTNQRPKESGIAMLPAVQPGLHKPFGSTVFIFTDIVLAMRFHARWFRESYRPLPVVAVQEKSNLKSLHLPTSLEDRRLIFCGPLQVTLPLARRHNGSVSDYTIPEADIATRITRRPPNDFLHLFEENARPWDTALDRLLQSLSAEEARLLLERLEMPPTEYRQILAMSKQQDRIESLAPLRIGGKKVIIGGDTVIERPDGWFVESSEERICNYPMRIDVVRTTDFGDTQYEITVECSDRPVTLRVTQREIHNGNLFAAVNRRLLQQQGEPLIYQQRKWARQSLFIAQELSEPETIRDAGRIGWTSDGVRFQFPNFALFHNGEIDRAPMAIELDDGPLPARDLSPARTDPLCVEQLYDDSSENGIVWGLAACVIQHLTRRHCHSQPAIGVVLDGAYAHETGASAAIALGCGSVNLAARRSLSIQDYISRQCSFHDFPVLIRLGHNSRLRMQASWLDTPKFKHAIMPLNPFAAISVASHPGFVRVCCDGHPQSLGATASAARWIIPNYLSDLLKRRFFFDPGGNDQLLVTILDDMAEWFDREGGSPSVVRSARKLLHFDSDDVPRAFVETVVRLHDEGLIACVRAGAEGTVAGKTPVAVVVQNVSEKEEGRISLHPTMVNDALQRKGAPAVPLNQIRDSLDLQGSLLARQGEGQGEQC